MKSWKQQSSMSTKPKRKKEKQVTLKWVAFSYYFLHNILWFFSAIAHFVHIYIPRRRRLCAICICNILFLFTILFFFAHFAHIELSTRLVWGGCENLLCSHPKANFVYNSCRCLRCLQPLNIYFLTFSVYGFCNL